MSAARAEGRRGPWRKAAAAVAGTIAVRLLGWTWRVREEGSGAPTVRGAREPIVYALWHGELLPLLWSQRGHGIVALISTHADGELIARIVSTLGYRTIRGSSSRGGARALLECVRALRAGTGVAFTTDGPRGPRRRSAPGAARAAAKARVPILPLGVVVDRAWRLQSWDRFVIPKPFARVTVRYGPLVWMMPEMSDEVRLRELDRALMAVCAPDDA